VKSPAVAGRFAERVVQGRDDGGSPERVLIWIERRTGNDPAALGAELADASTRHA